MRTILWTRLPKAAATLGLFTALVATPAVAFADKIDFLGDGKAATVGIHSPALGNIWVAAGELNWAAMQPSGLPSSFYTYCVDVNNWVRDPQDVTVQSSSLLANAGVSNAGAKAAWLINSYASLIHSNASYTGLDAAALQVAIWEVLYDSTPDLWTGSFNLLSGTNAAIVTKAQGYLSALFPVAGNYSVYNSSSTLWLDALPNLGQDQMIPTPEPASLLLCGLGLVGLSRQLIRRQRAQRV